MSFDDYNKILDTYKKTRMSHAEKEYIKNNLVKLGIPAKRPRYYYVMRAASLVSFVVLMLLGSFTYVSANSTPGDILYKAKINITENIRLMMLPDTDSRLEFQISRLDKRLDELNDAEASGQDIDTILENISDISSFILDESSKAQNPEEAIDLQNKLQSKLNSVKHEIGNPNIKHIVESNIEKVDTIRKSTVEDFVGQKVANNYDIEELTEDIMRSTSVSLQDAMKELEALNELKRNRAKKLEYYKIENQFKEMQDILRDAMISKINGDYSAVVANIQKFKAALDAYNNMIKSIKYEK